MASGAIPIFVGPSMDRRDRSEQRQEMKVLENTKVGIRMMRS